MLEDMLEVILVLMADIRGIRLYGSDFGGILIKKCWVRIPFRSISGVRCKVHEFQFGECLDGVLISLFHVIHTYI